MKTYTQDPSNCAVCGAEITEVQWAQDLENVPKLVRAWESGPLIEVPDLFPRSRPVPGSQRYTWQCGHEYRGTVTVTERDA